MGKTSSEVKERYNSKAYENIRLRVKAGQKEKIVAHAKDKGMSLNSYINLLIDADMTEDKA